MKKEYLVLLLIVLAFTMTACGTKETKNDSNNGNNTTPSTEKMDSDNEKSVSDVFNVSTTPNYATIKVDSSIKMDDESAWLGLVPQGKDYITELEADEVDVIWWQVGVHENDTDPYVWECDFESVDDGKYDVVVATSDDENVGYVAIQLSMEKKGDKLSFDFSNAKLKERPSK